MHLECLETDDESNTEVSKCEDDGSESDAATDASNFDSRDDVQLEVRTQVSIMKEGQSHQWSRRHNLLIFQKVSPDTS